MRFNARNLALSAIFTALYAVLVLILSGISFELVQVRVADALIPLSIVFGWPAVVGVTFGGAIANVVSPTPSVLTDVTLGSLANLVASILAWKIGHSKIATQAVTWFIGCTAATVIVTFTVGTYLAILTGMELWIWWLGIGVGSIISINILGYALIQVTKRLQVTSIT